MGYHGHLTTAVMNNLHTTGSLRLFRGLIEHERRNPNLTAHCDYQQIKIMLNSQKNFIFQDAYKIRGVNANPRKVVFYIPGTAFYMGNTAIDTTTATHLSLALEAPVVCTNHSLGPELPWPHNIDDVCRTIDQYRVDGERPREISIVGYSSGGLLAVLAALILKKRDLEIKELILLFPLLDLGGEFRDSDATVIKDFIPPFTQTNASALRNAVTLTRRDRFFDGGERDGKPFAAAIAYGFKEEDRKDLSKLRRYSPAWFKPETLKELPSIKIITRKTDYFRLEAKIFQENLIAAGQTPTVITLPNEDHAGVWDHLHTVYLTDLEKPGDHDITLRAPCDTITRCETRIKESQDILANSKKLKAFCKTPEFFSGEERPRGYRAASPVQNQL